MAEYPKVSVVISTYDRPGMLDKALRSVSEQTFTDYEVIVVDDCSPDVGSMRAVLEEWDATFSSKNIPFFAFRLGENSGYQCMPKNRGIEQARGDYIAYLDDDNTWRPDHLQACVDAIEADFSTDMVYSRLCYHIDQSGATAHIDDDGNTRIDPIGKDLPEGDGEGHPWDPNLLSHRNYIDTSTILHSKGAYWRLVRDSGYGWDESLRRFGDWNLVWRWAVHGLTGKLVDKVTVDYNWHVGSMQLTRPAIEVPICLNFAQYQALRRDRQTELRVAS
jgi:glycosyltransferase involved in cell wall biosynthesis